jgi:hypothetical protein
MQSHKIAVGYIVEKDCSADRHKFKKGEMLRGYIRKNIINGPGGVPTEVSRDYVVELPAYEVWVDSCVSSGDIKMSG